MEPHGLVIERGGRESSHSGKETSELVEKYLPLEIVAFIVHVHETFDL